MTFAFTPLSKRGPQALKAKHATFNEYLDAIPDPLRHMAVAGRAAIEAGPPEANGAIRWAHPTWSLGKRPGVLRESRLRAPYARVPDVDADLVANSLALGSARTRFSQVREPVSGTVLLASRSRGPYA